MTRDEFRSLSLEDVRKMSAYEILDFIEEYFYSINVHSEDDHFMFIRTQNLDKLQDKDKAWRYMVGVYRTYADWV